MGGVSRGSPFPQALNPPSPKKIFKKNCFPETWIFYLILRENYGIGAIIRIGQEIQCLPYAEFFL